MAGGFMDVEPGDRLMSTMPFFWIGGLDLALMAVNHRGGTHVVPEAPTAAAMLRALRERGVTLIQLWTHDVQALMNHPDAQPGDFARLRPTSAQQQALFKLAPPHLTPNSLGMSETFGPHSGERAGAHLPEDRATSFGRRVEAMERIIVDAATGEPRPPGEPGELWVRGPFLMQGMYKLEREEVFQRGGWYRTGDVCSLGEDGYLFFTGRSTETIKTKGANVAPREVELVLAGAPGVAEASVVGLPDPEAGEIVVAAVTPRAGVELSEAALVAYAQERLSSYKVPRRVVFLSFEEIPRTASAKVQKGPLRELLRARLDAEA
jgi:acyl-CoA synthetase (AMP-forming)/AMP-acid ligase II